jgi:WD40 repeat protein
VYALGNHGKRVWGVAFSPSGDLLATSSADGTIELWDVQAQTKVHTLYGHINSVWDAVFSPDGSRLASASYDKTAKVWDVETGIELLHLTGHTNWVMGVAFSPDGKSLATSSRDGSVRLYALDIRELLQIGCDRVTRNLTDLEWSLYMGRDVDYRETCVAGTPWALAAP